MPQMSDFPCTTCGASITIRCGHEDTIITEPLFSKRGYIAIIEDGRIVNESPTTVRWNDLPKAMTAETDPFKCGGCEHVLLLSVPRPVSWFDPISKQQETAALCLECVKMLKQHIRL